MEKQQRSDSDTELDTKAPASADLQADTGAGNSPKDAAVQAAAQVLVTKMAATDANAQAPATAQTQAAAPAQTQAPAKEGVLKKIEHAIGTAEHDVVEHAVAIAGGAKNLAVDVGEHLEVVGGEAVGVAELAGLRYSVKTYEAQVDAGLYRGSRLDDAGMASLKQQGVQGVVSLCLEHTDDAVLAAKYGIDALNVKILDNSAPSVAQMMEFINFARAHPPTYVHCEAGKGRTGTAVACYRIAVDGWTAEQAIAEGKTLGLSLINQIAFIRHFAEVVGGGAQIAPVEAASASASASAT